MTYAEELIPLKTSFPLLTVHNSRRTSDRNNFYNCIAWAAGEDRRIWWPDANNQAYWPMGIPRALTLDAFVQAYKSVGYTEMTDPKLDPDKEKVSVFISPNYVPTHACRQVADGWWASKLGKNIDIEHELIAVSGPLYGNVAVTLARPRVKLPEANQSINQKNEQALTACPPPPNSPTAAPASV